MTHRPSAREPRGARRPRARAHVVLAVVVALIIGIAAGPTGAGASTAPVGPPSWWQGDCDATHWNAAAKAAGWTGPGAHRLGASYLGVPVCGPRSAYGAPDVRWLRAGWGHFEWECTELAFRFMAQIYGVSAYGANGNTVVSNYTQSAGGGLVRINNGTHGKAPQPGDIMSFTSPDNSAGHVAVVSSSTVNSSGNGSVTLITQNDTADGWRTLAVTGWMVQPFGSYSAYGWLHDPLGRGIQKDTGDHRPFASWDQFVAQQKLDFEGSPGTTSTRASAGSTLSTGSPTPSQYIDYEMSGPWFGGQTAPVARLYWAYFGRIPDYAGLTYWTQVHRRGGSLDKVSSAFATSSEFTNKYGSLSNAAFVNLVYSNVLGRAGDPDGVAYWTGQLDQHTKTRGQVMLGFSESNEYVSKMTAKVTVVMTFAGMLHRTPSKSDLAASEPQAGLPLVEFIRLSTEYATRVGA